MTSMTHHHKTACHTRPLVSPEAPSGRRLQHRRSSVPQRCIIRVVLRGRQQVESQDADHIWQHGLGHSYEPRPTKCPANAANPAGVNSLVLLNRAFEPCMDRLQAWSW